MRGKKKPDITRVDGGGGDLEGVEGRVSSTKGREMMTVVSA